MLLSYWFKGLVVYYFNWTLTLISTTSDTVLPLKLLPIYPIFITNYLHFKCIQNHTQQQYIHQDTFKELNQGCFCETTTCSSRKPEIKKDEHNSDLVLSCKCFSGILLILCGHRLHSIWWRLFVVTNGFVVTAILFYPLEMFLLTR